MRALGERRPVGAQVRQQVHVGLVGRPEHGAGRQRPQPCDERRHHRVAGRIAAGDGPGSPPEGHLPHPPVQRVPAIAGRCRCRCSRDTVQGPGRSSSAVIRASGFRSPSPGRPLRGRSARPATPPALQRPIQRRTVAGSYSTSAAVCAGDTLFRDSSTITARTTVRPWPRSRPRNRSCSAADA